MTAVVAFAPIVGRRPRVLVLGSLPGVASLQANQYYAHPRNAFWTIIAELTGTSVHASYAERCRAAKRLGLAIWDVLAAAVRPGSLDAAIVPATAKPNDFAAFLERRPSIELIAFNGATAATLYVRQVLPRLPERARRIERVRLPSTSPAHAGLSLQRKCRSWHSALRPHLDADGP